MEKGDEIELTVESLSGDGKTVARKDNVVYFIENAVPGDTVRARIWKIKKNYAEARSVQILKPSPRRVRPECRHFGVCGGCRWQDLSYESQLEFKRQHVREAFVRIGGFQDPDVQPVIGCAEPYYYRNKMEFTFSGQRWLTEEEMSRAGDEPPGVYLGLHVPQRYDKVVDIEECMLQSKVSNEIVEAVRSIAREWKWDVYSTETEKGFLRHLVIRQSKRTGDLMVNLVTNGFRQREMEDLTDYLLSRIPQITTVVNNSTTRKSMVATGEEEKIYHGEGCIREKLGRYIFQVSANSFFQTNTEQAEILYSVAKEYANLSPSDVLYDLYSGTGTIAIYLSEAVERVVGVEVVGSAIRDAEKNARLNQVSNCYFLQGDLKDRLTRDNAWLEEHPRPTVIVADPPRNGMHEKVIEKIIRLSPDRVVYISCNPSTQARDAKLLASGGYRLQRIVPVDMFPHTDHIEAVALFLR
jgi:23S rRNA (uracil1939-C5)-methyltransferase